MDRKSIENYQPEDFVTDESFINYHFRLNNEDEIFWEKWMNDHPGKTGFTDSAKEMLDSLSFTLPGNEFRGELAKMKKAIDYKAPVFKTGKPVFKGVLHVYGSWLSSKARKRRIGKIAIVALLLLAPAYFLFQHFNNPGVHLAEKHNDSKVPVVFTLPDSTIVTLASKSVLRYSRKFTEQRIVYLDGEAAFHVKKDIVHPFKVYSGELVATVLGTKFNMKKQQGDSIIQVELLEGKLKVESIDSEGKLMQSMILEPEERVVYNSHKQKLLKESWQLNTEPPATTTRMEFSKSNFKEIAEQLKKVYSVTVINESKKDNWRFTGKFKNHSAREIIENICIVEKLSYLVKGDTILIR